jgi:hypothetical protein
MQNEIMTMSLLWCTLRLLVRLTNPLWSPYPHQFSRQISGNGWETNAYYSAFISRGISLQQRLVRASLLDVVNVTCATLRL